jgi:2-keto-4-pentenoate hydratase
MSNMSHMADPVADNTLNNASAIGRRSRKGRADHTEMVKASMKNNRVRVMKAEKRMIPATPA